MRISRKSYKSVPNKAKEVRVKTKTLQFLTGIFCLTIFLGCGGVREKEIPGANVIGIRTTIERILISSLAFDGAIVAVEGIARDVGEVSEGRAGTATQFKLYDARENFINVSAPGKRSILENDTLIVGGIFRREKNEIEAKQIEKTVESLKRQSRVK